MSFFGKPGFLLVGLAFCGQLLAVEEEVRGGTSWQEHEVLFPAPPREDGLQAFYVSAASDNRFFVDLATLDVGDDGVVRYALVVLAPEGGRTVTFEGMRCETRARRIYASGRQDGTWSKSRNADWMRILETPANRAHAALFIDYFCPDGLIVRDTATAKAALRRGSRSDNKFW